MSDEAMSIIPSHLEKEISNIMASVTSYDPHAGRTYIPASKVRDIKSKLAELYTSETNKKYLELKENMLKIKIQELKQDKHYFIVVPKESDSRDIEALLKICEDIAKDWPSLNSIRVVLSRGVEIDESKNSEVIKSLIDIINSEVDKTLLSGTEAQISSIDTAMSGGAKNVADIESKIFNQRAAIRHSADAIQRALIKLGDRMTEKYYIVDKQSIK